MSAQGEEANRMENNTTQLKKFTPETMKEIVYVTWPTLAPAGDKAVVDWKGDMKKGLSSKIHLMENLLQKCDRRYGRSSKRICFDTRWSERKTASFSFRWRSYGVSVE
ncbi:MAG: hypothetical protein ACLR5J_09985 [Lachnospiraceae bacterium]